jgi:hypothetical protein
LSTTTLPAPSTIPTVTSHVKMPKPNSVFQFESLPKVMVMLYSGYDLHGDRTIVIGNPPQYNFNNLDDTRPNCMNVPPNTIVSSIKFYVQATGGDFVQCRLSPGTSRDAKYRCGRAVFYRDGNCFDRIGVYGDRFDMDLASTPNFNATYENVDDFSETTIGSIMFDTWGLAEA